MSHFLNTGDSGDYGTQFIIEIGNQGFSMDLPNIGLGVNTEDYGISNKNDLLNIDNMGCNPEHQDALYYGNYPGDLLCLTKRVYERHPQWTPRKFLTEAKKFSNKVLEIIEDNN